MQIRSSIPPALNAQQVLMGMPGYQLYEYQLVLAIPEVLKEKLRKTRQQLFESQGLSAPGGAALLLPLVKFRQRQLLEEKLVRSLTQVVMGWRPFRVTLKDFKSHPTHSIVIPVATRSELPVKAGLQQCIRDLRTMQHLLKPDREHHPWFPAEHHIQLAGKLSAHQYEKIWQAYAHRHFTGQFVAEACLLLKRRTGEQHWQILKRLELKDLPVIASQASLFDA